MLLSTPESRTEASGKVFRSSGPRKSRSKKQGHRLQIGIYRVKRQINDSAYIDLKINITDRQIW